MKKLVTLAALFGSLCAFFVSAETLSFPHIETSGYGEVVAKPDMAEFTVQVEESTMTADGAKNKVDKAVNDFISRLTQTGVSRDDISASNIYLAPKYHYPKSGQSELVGYQANRSVTVIVHQLDKLNTYLDAAIEGGINRIDSIQLKVKDQKEYQKQARLAAIEDANNKAKALADGFDMNIEGVWKISYNNGYTRPVLMKAMSMDSRESSASGYQDTTLVIKDQVSVIYKLAP